MLCEDSSLWKVLKCVARDEVIRCRERLMEKA